MTEACLNLALEYVRQQDYKGARLALRQALAFANKECRSFDLPLLPRAVGRFCAFSPQSPLSLWVCAPPNRSGIGIVPPEYRRGLPSR